MIRTRLLLALLMALSAAPVWGDELKLLGGKSVPGTLDKITEADITINGAATPVGQALELFLRANRTVPTGDYIEVQLTDDSLLRCTKITYTAKDASLTLTSGATVKVPLAGLFTVLRDGQDAKIKEQWPTLLKAAAKKRADRIFVVRDGNLNPISGVFGAIDEAKQTIKFKPEGKDAAELDTGLDKLQAFQFARTEAPADNNACKLIDTDGNVLIAAKLTYEAGLFTAISPYGQKMTFDNKLVAKIDYNLGRLIFLSDLDEKLTVSPFWGGFNPLQKNMSLDKNPIIVQDKQYAKGLSCYAGAEMEYNLGGKYKKLSAILSADLRIAEEGQGQVTVSIYADREKRFSQEVSMKAPIPINLDVRDVTTLRIVFSGPGANPTPFHGHATLANAHVSQ